MKPESRRVIMDYIREVAAAVGNEMAPADPHAPASPALLILRQRSPITVPSWRNRKKRRTDHLLPLGTAPAAKKWHDNKKEPPVKGGSWK